MPAMFLNAAKFCTAAAAPAARSAWVCTCIRWPLFTLPERFSLAAKKNSETSTGASVSLASPSK